MARKRENKAVWTQAGCPSVLGVQVGCRGARERGLSALLPHFNAGEGQLPAEGQGEGSRVCERERGICLCAGPICAHHKDGHPQGLPGSLHASLSYVPRPHCPSEPVAVLLGPASGHGLARLCGTGRAPLWPGIAFEAAPFAAQSPCFALRPQAYQPGGASPTLSGGIGLGHVADGPEPWALEASKQAGAPVASLHLPSPSFPSSPPPACVQQIQNQPLTALPSPSPARPALGAEEEALCMARWGVPWV